jgi:hypothetical protein
MIMKKILFIVGATFLFACGNTEKPVEEVSEEVVTEEVQVEITKHGEDITEEGAITAAEFLAEFEGKDSLETKITTNIIEVCSKKGCWMMIDLGNDNNMRVTFKDYEFFVPKDAAGKLTTIKGIATIDTTDVATLKHYAEDAEASQEEIDAITEPEINYSFEAIGVIIKGESSTTDEK